MSASASRPPPLAAPAGGGPVAKPALGAGAGTAEPVAGPAAPAPEAPGAASFDTVTGSANFTLAGARHTRSLQDWKRTVPARLALPGAAPAAAVSGSSISTSPFQAAIVLASNSTRSFWAAG